MTVPLIINFPHFLLVLYSYFPSVRTSILLSQNNSKFYLIFHLKINYVLIKNSLLSVPLNSRKT